MRLFYFTNSYPYDDNTLWKKHELEVLKKSFDITVIPAFDLGLKTKQQRVEGVKYKEPLLKPNTNVRVKRMFLEIVRSRFRGAFIKNLLKARMFSKENLIKWIQESYEVLCFIKHPVIKSLIKESDTNTVWYFYWGRNLASIIPFLNKQKCKVACRFHGFDLYLERNGGYIPFQSSIVHACDIILPCSSHGEKYLKQLFPDAKGTYHIARLGTKYTGISEFKPEKYLKLASCSNIIPVKRLSLLIEALSLIQIEIEWIHIGSGDDSDKIEKEAHAKLKKNVKFNFVGALKPDEVQHFYIKNCFDLFINVSESEGVPVSIMEALATGIPVYATDVGGSGEIVDAAVGKSLPADITPAGLAKELEDFFMLDAEIKRSLRQNAVKRFNDMCNTDVNAERLLEFLMEKSK